MYYLPLMIFLIVSLGWMSLGFVKINHLLAKYSLNAYKNDHPIKHPMSHGWQSKTRNVFYKKIRNLLECLRSVVLIIVFPTQNECNKLTSSIFFRMLITYAAVAVLFLDFAFLFLNANVISATIGTVFPLIAVYGISGSFVVSRTDVQSNVISQERYINEIIKNVKFKMELCDCKEWLFGLLVIFNSVEEKEKFANSVECNKVQLKVLSYEIDFDVSDEWGYTTKKVMEMDHCIGDNCCKYQLSVVQNDVSKLSKFYNQLTEEIHNKENKVILQVKFKYEKEREFDMTVFCDLKIDRTNGIIYEQQ